MSEKEITPRIVSPGAGEAPAPQTGSIVVLSDDDVEKVAGGMLTVKICQDAWQGSAQYVD